MRLSNRGGMITGRGGHISKIRDGLIEEGRNIDSCGDVKFKCMGSSSRKPLMDAGGRFFENPVEII